MIIPHSSLFSLFPKFAAHQNLAESISGNRSLCLLSLAVFIVPSTVLKSEGQHTRCTHRVLPRLAGGAAPSTPEKAGDAMSAKKDPRDAWIKLRVTREEKELVAAKAHAQGQTVADFLRQRALDYRLRQTPLEKERVRQLARIGVNLNQLARWANIHKTRAETMDVLIALMSFERAVKADTPPPPEAQDAPCS